MSKKNLLCLGILISLLSAGISYAAKEYYPNNVGNLWILDSTDGSQQHRIGITETITYRDRDVNLLSRETKNGVDEFYIATESNGDLKTYWSKVHNGFLGDLFFEYDTPQTFIPANLRLGYFWKIVGKTTSGIDMQTDCTVVAQEDVTVPAGTFHDCLKIQQNFLVKSFLPINVTSFMWLAPDIGIVKEQDSSRVVFELSQYKVFWSWDVNRDQIINIYDLVLVGKHFGEQIVGEPGNNPDVNDDGVVKIFDLVLVGSHFGENYSSF